MKKAERDLIMRQQVTLPQTPRERRELAALDEDLKSIERRGKPVRLRLRNFHPSAEAYLASAGGPLPYMLRLREIERRTATQVAELHTAWRVLAEVSGGDDRLFAERWRSTAERWAFDEINDLIARHNRWYPVESGLPMDPRTGDYVTVNGRSYRLEPRDADWVLDRFPPSLDRALVH